MNAVNLDDLHMWVTLLRTATQDKRDAEERINVARTKIQDALGDADTGLIDGQPVVRWASVTSRRLDLTLAKARIPADLLTSCYLEQTSRRFTLVDVEELP